MFVFVYYDRLGILSSADNACAFLWTHPSYCFSFLRIDGIFKAHQLIVV
jgi:hypothetical protein